MELLGLKLTNYKGMSGFEIAPQGKSLDIFGDNGTGKTSLYDAWSWLLFGKDSLERPDSGRGAFDILPLDSDGKRIGAITECSVEGVLAGANNGRQVTLKRTYKEKWTKRRGSAVSEMTGHETKFEIDGVPAQERDYQAFIAGIANPQLFKLLTNPLAFNDDKVLPWAERRAILAKLSGDVSDQEVIGADADLGELPALLAGRSMADYRKVAQASQSEINGKLKTIPVRIDEASKALPPSDSPGSAVNLDSVRKDRAEKASLLATMDAGGGVAERIKALRELEGQIVDMDNQHRQAVSREVAEARRVLVDCDSDIRQLESSIRLADQEMQGNEGARTKSRAAIDALAKQWEAAEASEWSGSGIDANCPTCGRRLPDEQVAAAQAKAAADFNQRKAAELRRIEDEGAATRRTLEGLSAANQKLLQAKADGEKGLAVCRESRVVLAARVVDAEARLNQPSPDPRRHQLLDRQLGLQADIEDMKRGSVAPAREKLAAEISTLDLAIAAGEKARSDAEQRAKGMARIEELKTEQRQLAAEYERLERVLYLIGQFDKGKALLLQEKINAQFELVRFKLFDIQINGAIVECCETTIGGVPWGSGLNHGAQIAGGLDIIRTLQRHYSMTAPVWVDNAEAITALPEMGCQMICLYVSEQDKVLRVEERRGALVAAGR